MLDAAVSGALCAALRGEALDPLALDPAAARRLFERARAEGVHLMVAHRLWERGDLSRCAPVLRDLLVRALQQQVAGEESARPELQRVLAECARDGVSAVVMKGAALAYTHYSSPALRPRVDADVLVAPESRAAAVRVLDRLHYAALPMTSGDLVMHQAAFARQDPAGARHVVDVHWQVSNPHVFARALPAGDVLAAAVSVPQLGDVARAPSAIHSLAIACIHRLAHHGGGERLIWIFDIHLLAERFSAAEREAFVSMAVERRLHGVCVHGLEAAVRCFGGQGTSELLARMNRRRPLQMEPSARFAAAPLGKLAVLRSDLAAIDGWRAKLALVREHLFPPPAFMRQRYGTASSAMLPVLYVWRIARGCADWLRPAAARSDGEE